MNTFVYHLKTQLNRYGWHVKQTKVLLQNLQDSGTEEEFEYYYEVGRTLKSGLTLSYLTLSFDLSESHYVYKEKLTEVEIWILKDIGRYLDFCKFEKENRKRIQ